MNELSSMGGMIGALIAIVAIVFGIPIVLGLLFKLFILAWGL